MSNRSLIRAINAVLDDWAKLTDEQKGPLYEDAVKSLMSWKSELEKTSDV